MQFKLKQNDPSFIYNGEILVVNKWHSESFAWPLVLDSQGRIILFYYRGSEVTEFDMWLYCYKVSGFLNRTDRLPPP